MTDRTASTGPRRWQRRILRATLPLGVVLLGAWILWLAVPALMGATRTDFTFPSRSSASGRR